MRWRATDQPAGAGRRIALLGPFTVVRDGAQLTDRQIGSRKARTLLKRLAVQPDRVVGVPALVDTIWPDDPPDQPDRHLATLVSRLRSTLGSGAIVREGGGYRFGDGYRTDLDEATTLVTEAERRLAAQEFALADSAAGRALELLGQGELLADEPDAEWAALARTGVQVLRQRARRCALHAAVALRQWDTAQRLADAALVDEPFNEDACRALMRAHHGRGEPGLALAAFERLRGTLAAELGTDPADETRQLHLSILRGEPEPAPVAGSGSHDSRVGPRPDPGVVGRQAEVDGLRQAWSDATAGQGGLVLLAGEAGIGKTSLANELARLAEATGGTVARARCYETERSLFLQPVAEALRTVVVSTTPDVVRDAAGPLAGSLGTLVAEVAAVAPSDEPHRGSPELERRRIFEAVGSFVRALSQRQPLLLFLDDLHLAGSSTIELMHFLARRVVDARTLVVATVRVEEGAEVLDTLASLARRWDLGPLPEEAVQELARRSGLAGLTGQIMAQTRGHSLFVVETLRAMAEQPTDPAGARVPESLRAAVLARMRRAGPEVEELLRAAATLGGNLDPTLLAALMDEPVEVTARRMEAASRARLLHEAGPAYEFANDLIQEIAYQTTPLPSRIARHRRAAALLTGSPEAVAAHAARAGDWPAAVEAYLQAAEAATRRYANRDATRLLEQALEVAVRIDDPLAVARARLARGRVREAFTDYQGAYEDHVAVVDLARAHGRADLELAALRELGGDLLVGMRRPIRDCIPYLNAALALAESTGDVAGQVDILGRLAVIWTNRLRFDLAAACAERARDLAEPRFGAAVQASALDAMKTTLVYRGDIPALEQVLPRLEASLRRHRHPTMQVWTEFEKAVPALARAEWSRAADQIERAMTLTRETGYVAYQAPFLAHLSWVERARGRYGSALRWGTRAADLAGETGHPWWVVLAEVMLGWTLTEVGALDEANARLREGLRAAERDGAEGYLLRCLGHLAWVDRLRGESAQAAMWANRMEEMLAAASGGPGLHAAHAVLAGVAARLDDAGPAAVQAPLARVRDAAGRAGWVEVVAWTDLLRARSYGREHPRRAAVLATGVLGAARNSNLPGIAWQAHSLLAALPGVAGAQAHRSAARAIVDQLVASLDDHPLAAGWRERTRQHMLSLLDGSDDPNGTATAG